MNSPSQSVAITPIFKECTNLPDYVSVNGEIYFLLKEENLNDLERICAVLRFLSLSLFNSQNQLEFNLSDLQAVLELLLVSLGSVTIEINSFKF